MIRVGICGAGHIVPNHCQAIWRTADIAVTAISSRTKASAAKMARQYRIPRVYEDHRQLIESPEVDVVLVAGPNYQHYPLTLQAIAAGKHVFVEKPLALNVAEAQEMVAAAKQAGVQLLYAEQLPLAPKFVRLAEMAQQGAFGQIYMARQLERHAGPYSPWFFNQDTAGGGALMDLGCHSIAVLREIFNKEKVQKVSAVSRTLVHTESEVEDFMIVQLFFTGGAIGVVECNWCHPGGMDSITEIFGTAGNGYADLMKGSGLQVYSEKGYKSRGGTLHGWRRPMFDEVYECGYQAQIEALANTLLHGEPPAQSGEDGLEILKIMSAAYQSAEQNGKLLPIKK